jgi:transcriptional regulator with XRE-family HTH domain
MRESLDRIRRAVADGSPLKKSALAKEAGVSVDALSGVESEDWNPKARTVDALIGALDRIAASLAA